MTLDGYDFSQSYHAHVVAYSPGTTFLATAYHDRIVVRSTSTLQIVRTWQCLPSALPSSSSVSPPSSSLGRSTRGKPVGPPASSSSAAPGSRRATPVELDSLLWSPDSMHLFAYASKRETAWVFALTRNGDGESGELAKLEGGAEGLVKIEWGRKGEVLAWSDHGVSALRFHHAPGNR